MTELSEEKKKDTKLRKSDATRARIIEAARERFRKEGFERTTIRKVAGDAGIDPSIRQSGQFVGNQSHMSKRGSPYLRRAIWLASSVATLYNPVMKAFYQKKRDEGKAHRTAVGAVCRKLLYTVFALLKSGQPYDPNLAR